MIYAIMSGNAGNQFFQYAFARKVMLKKSDKLTIDMRHVLKGNNKHKAEDVLKYFNTVNFIENTDSKYYPIQRFIYALLLRVLPPLTDKRYTFLRKHVSTLNKLGIYFYDGPDYLQFNYDSNTKNTLINGYFECEKYFEDIKDILIEELTPKYPLLDSNKDLYNEIINSESICVTVRRFDETSNNTFYSCDARYFYNGVNYIKSIYPSSKVFVFSDDINWCKENLDFKCETYYESGNDPIWEKVRLMSSCKHFVISNSTFSWWAQYLSKNKNKIVVGPRIWRNEERVIDIYSDSWVYLDDKGNKTVHE